jgi:putative hydroxymethylpyrimidine transport system substrate-binding protein
VIVARANEVGPKAATLRRFLQALSRAHQALRDAPGTAVDALVKANPDLDRGLQLASVKATLPVFFPEDKAFPWGFQNADEWKAYGQWMLDNKLVERLPTPTSLTNEFLPGRGI